MRGRPRSFLSDRSGATALEFGMVAPLLLALTFSTLETGWTMTRAVLLDRALDTAIRLVRLGGTDTPKTQTAIKQRICAELTVVHDCAAALLVEMVPIKTVTDFPTGAAKCVDRAAKVAPVVNYTPGAQSSVMFVRACLTVDLLTPLIGVGLALPKDPSGGYGIVSSTAFMNEPG